MEKKSSKKHLDRTSEWNGIVWVVWENPLHGKKTYLYSKVLYNHFVQRHFYWICDAVMHANGALPNLINGI